MVQLFYRRLHIASGSVYIAAFNDTQVDSLSYLPLRGAERACMEAVGRWNRQQPGEWQYTYLGTHNPEVAQYERQHDIRF